MKSIDVFNHIVVQGNSSFGDKCDLIALFATDMTEELAKQRVVNLSSGSSSPNEKYTWMGSTVYGPLLIKFVKRIFNVLEKGFYEHAVFLARDGLSFYHVATQLVDQYPAIYGDLKGKFSLSYLSRKMLGQKDEIAGFEEEDQNAFSLVEYMKQCHMLKPTTLLVDIGLYGSMYRHCVVNSLWQEGNYPGMYFLYSKNPAIPGYLNDYGFGLSDGQLENKIVDTLETTIPFPTSTASGVKKKGERYYPLTKEVSSPFWQSLYESWLIGLSLAVQKDRTHDASVPLIDPSTASLHGWSPILPSITPEWSGKKAFIKKFTSDVPPLPPVN